MQTQNIWTRWIKSCYKNFSETAVAVLMIGVLTGSDQLRLVTLSFNLQKESLESALAIGFRLDGDSVLWTLNKQQ